MVIYPYLAKVSLGLSLVFASTHPAFSQIIPNGAGTLISPQGSQINISGGTQAGGNLFHSFQDFNVNSSQVANFLSNPQTQNILSRINGGNPSFINGLLQVTGGNSNLFLMNPAGIVFGQEASLNVPASFTATTANGIGFGNNVFHAFGDNNFSALIGNPDSFIFSSPQAGSIVNAGNLAVGIGQNISLIAGNTINTGNLTAPGGEIQLLAVPGTNRVRLSQPGQVLSLEFVPPVSNGFRAVDLPALLTGSNLPGIAINPTGQVQVAGTSLPNQQGIAVASGRIDVSSVTGNGGVVQVMGDRVAALNARINANGATGGGTVRLGGEYLGGINTGIAPALRFNSQRTFVDQNSLIRANATVTGEGGRVIVWADQNTGYFGRITGRGATGRGAFVEVSGRENLAFDGRVEIPGANGLLGSLLLDPANITIVAGANNSQPDDAQVNVDATILSSDLPINMTISAGALSAIPVATAINITASGNIDFQSNITLNGGFAAPSISFTAATITSGAFSLNTTGRGLNIVADTINIPNLTIDTGLGGFGPSGSINFTSSQGSITTGNVSTAAVNGSGGSVTFTSQGSITNISTGTNVGDGGNVSLTAQGNINILNNGIATTVNDIGNSGNIILNSQGNIFVIDTIATNANNQGNGGNITLNAPNGNIIGGSVRSQATNAPNNSGVISINAGSLLRLNNFCSAGISICSAGQAGASDGTITIRHGGSITTPFTIGNSSINGTAGAINAGTGANTIPIITVVPAPPAINTYGNITIITTAPEPPSIPPVLIPLLINPSPPPAPPPVIVGESPKPEEPAAEVPLPLPTPSPTPSPSPTPTPSPIPSPIPTSSPSSNPNPNPVPEPPLRTTLEINTNSQQPPIVLEPFSGNLTFITNPTSAELSPRLRGLEESFQSEFQQYLGVSSQVNPPNLQETQDILNQITQTARVKPGLVYVFFAPPGGDGNFSSIELASQTNRVAKETDILEAVVITGIGEPVRVLLPGTTRRQVLEVANNFRSEVTKLRNSRRFLGPAQQMYKWILEPLEEELQKQGINNLVFLMDSGLRSIPLAAIHDGKGFIVERYSVGLMPSLNLTPLDHVPLEGAQVLAMGANTFGDSGLNPLPAVPLELNTISQLWEGAEFLNETFTLNNLIQQRQNRPFRMIHLATHGVFNPGDRANSYIQLWDGRLRLDQLDQLNWGNPPVDLLVLSACQTALGDKDAELGFAGLAINAGVRSALASLWEVNDAATLGLMTKFYQQLQVTSTKSEALRLAQLAMIRGEVRLENGNLVTADGLLPLSEEVRSLSDLNLTHPYFWSGFTMVGNPW